MKIEDVVIAWNPRSDHVKVGFWPDNTGWSDDCLMTDSPSWNPWGFPVIRSKVKRIARLFVIFNTMVVRDGVAVDAAHRALLAIDEYRETIPEDQEGAAP